MHYRVHKKTQIVVCRATNPANLHSAYGDRLGLSDDYVDRELPIDVRPGDLADGTQKPENYPQPSPEEIRQELVDLYVRRGALSVAREKAIADANADAVAAIDEAIADDEQSGAAER